MNNNHSLFGHARTLSQIVFFGGLGGFLFGYDTGVISGALPFIREELGTGPWTEGMIVSLTSMGALVGAAFGGAASDRHGRKLMVFACDVLYFIGACVMAFAPDITALCLGRAVVGVAVGTSSVNIPMYLSELAPVRIRGSMTAVNTVMVDVGQLASYAVGAALASSGHWRFMLGLSALPAAVQCLGMLWMPESPAWLKKKGLWHQAEEIMRLTGMSDDGGVGVGLVGGGGGGRVGGMYGGIGRGGGGVGSSLLGGGANRRLFDGGGSVVARGGGGGEVGRVLAVGGGGDDDDDDDDDDEGDNGGGGGGKAPSFFGRSLRALSRAWSRSDIRPQLRLAMILQVLQQAVGINVVSYYSVTIIQAAGIADHAAAVHLALAVAAMSALGSIVGVAAMDGSGRRPLLLASLAGCAVALIILGGCFTDIEYGPSSPVSEVAQGTCAAATTCRDCLAVSCGFCAAGEAGQPGRCLVGSNAGPEGAVEVLAAAAAAAAAKKHKKHKSFIHHHHAKSPPPPISPPPSELIIPAADVPATATAAVAAAVAAATAPAGYPTARPQSLSLLSTAPPVSTTATTTATATTQALQPPISALLGQDLPQVNLNFSPPAVAVAAGDGGGALDGVIGTAAPPLATATSTSPPPVPATSAPPFPPPPRTRHRSHQNIITCDGNWQFHSCPSRFGLAALAAQMMYVLCFQAGVSPVPWVVAAEIFPADVRGAAAGLAATANWSANLLVSAVFPAVFKHLGGSVVFGALFCFATMAWLYAWIVLPETRGLSPAEVGAAMRGGGGGGGGEGGGARGGGASSTATSSSGGGGLIGAGVRGGSRWGGAGAGAGAAAVEVTRTVTSSF